MDGAAKKKEAAERGAPSFLLVVRTRGDTSRKSKGAAGRLAFWGEERRINATAARSRMGGREGPAVPFKELELRQRETGGARSGQRKSATKARKRKVCASSNIG